MMFLLQIFKFIIYHYHLFKKRKIFLNTTNMRGYQSSLFIFFKLLKSNFLDELHFTIFDHLLKFKIIYYYLTDYQSRSSQPYFLPILNFNLIFNSDKFDCLTVTFHSDTKCLKKLSLLIFLNMFLVTFSSFQQ